MGAAYEDPAIGETLRSIVDAAGSSGETIALAAFIAKQRMVDGEESIYAPYLDVLPWSPSPYVEELVNDQEHVLWWTDGEIGGEPGDVAESLDGLRSERCATEQRVLSRPARWDDAE